jgi:riboflavin kinase / FMN adenylyltransferase
MTPEVRVYRSLDEVPAEFGPSALSIGNFDGVHAGHRRILRRVKEVAAERSLNPSVLTFDPHPTKVVAPARAPRLMTAPGQRCGLMREEGIRQVLILPFTPEIARLSPQEFVEQIVAGRLGARAVLVGENFRFGHKQAGDVAVLKELGERYGFTTEIVPCLDCRGQRVSSTAVRQMIESGNVARAARFLERPFALEGRVVPGHGIGSKQTVPTLNLAPETEVLPGTGVYVTRTQDLENSRAWASVTNVGYRPTFGGDTLSIETFLLDPLNGPPPERIRVEFLWRLRAEKKFPSPETLKAQILRDVQRAQAYFRRLGKWTRTSFFPVDSMA